VASTFKINNLDLILRVQFLGVYLGLGTAWGPFEGDARPK